MLNCGCRDLGTYFRAMQHMAKSGNEYVFLSQISALRVQWSGCLDQYKEHAHTVTQDDRLWRMVHLYHKAYGQQFVICDLWASFNKKIGGREGERGFVKLQNQDYKSVSQRQIQIWIGCDGWAWREGVTRRRGSFRVVTR